MIAKIESLSKLRTMLKEAYEACYSEYMGCPWCIGHIGHDNEWHDEFCDWVKLNRTAYAVGQNEHGDEIYVRKENSDSES